MSQRKRSQRSPVSPSIHKPNGDPPVIAVSAPSGTPSRVRWHTLVSLAILLVAPLLAYSNTFSSPFVWDGVFSIRENPAVHQCWPPWPCLKASTRPLATWSFALNFAIHGRDVRGYHATNLAIHILAGWVLFGLVLRTLELPALHDRYRARARWLALAAALLWVVHPLQTESVTYIYQRYESLMGLFFLLSVYLFARGAGSQRPIVWHTLSILCCAASLACKEVGGMIPLVILWYDRAFLASSWRILFRRRWPYYAACLALFLFLVASVVHSRDFYRSGGLLYWDRISPLYYAMSQPKVILRYLQLSFWPQGQCLDYNLTLSSDPWDIVPQVIAIAALLGLIVTATFRHPSWGFLGGWFILILAPTSSILPAADLMFEHRMYLPLAAVTVATVILLNNLPRYLNTTNSWEGRYRKLSVTAIVLSVAILVVATFQRNRVYESDLAVWIDGVKKAPGNARAYNHLGMALGERREIIAARTCFRRAIELDPNWYSACLNLGDFSPNAEEAIGWYRRALTINPECLEAANNLGVAQLRLGHAAEAIECFRKALRSDPENALYRSNLVKGLVAQGQFEAALTEYRAAKQRSPDLVPPTALASWMQKHGLLP